MGKESSWLHFQPPAETKLSGYVTQESSSEWAGASPQCSDPTTSTPPAEPFPNTPSVMEKLISTQNSSKGFKSDDHRTWEDFKTSRQQGGFGKGREWISTSCQL
ncbi:hypothetical protein DV515_00007606 [Chloebia gouldiae]|uniref:Uncharacterized protein n=1 Tax=Chloebia gouldiae TaxID=44316 RepID=A0A3L8SH84_CHLGU|nr:hypothetical protein DV515_00007606 [Chloebia gouldiae]